MNKEELIEKYFSNQLSENEFQQLEQLLQEDAELRENFYNELEIKQAITQEKHVSLKERLQKLEKKPTNKKSWYLYAAAVTILIVIGSLFYNLKTNDQLYAENFEAYPNVISLSTRSEVSIENKESEAFKLYDAEKFNKAAIAFQDLYEKNEKDYLRFYHGVSLLAKNNTIEGIEVLEGYDWQEQQSDFTIPAFWYVGLAYLKLEKTSEARNYLKKVALSDSQLRSQAQRLLKQLD
ncbi:hypothetical protein APR41_15915 [Salegentibacter salinarum]|uniref:Tetratricopeptide repeat protein n=1 Tax=Salegentibacter salinarum TaxID=447422 RepID=A0A2N0TXG4_9FLAO|nr:hypothetical protein [Salegentibacter salinarum]PKD19445.1 hypothetical protein APR41_15915 [Salegentibacter salinarum]SKB92175.1 hypothetical protein SAMN05660903_03280 [Salegentibacter salinarum]